MKNRRKKTVEQEESAFWYSLKGWEDGQKFSKEHITEPDRWQLQSADSITIHFGQPSMLGTLVQIHAYYLISKATSRSNRIHTVQNWAVTYGQVVSCLHFGWKNISAQSMECIWRISLNWELAAQDSRRLLFRD